MVIEPQIQDQQGQAEPLAEVATLPDPLADVPMVEPVALEPAEPPSLGDLLAGMAWRFREVHLRQKGDNPEDSTGPWGMQPWQSVIALTIDSQQSLAGFLEAASRRVNFDRVTRPLLQLQDRFGQSEEVLEVRRLALALEDARHKLKTAEWTGQDALARARQALREGADPAGAEADYKDANQDKEVLSNRISVLEEMLQDARGTAKIALRRAQNVKLAEMITQVEQEASRLSGKLLEMLTGALGELHPLMAALELLKRPGLADGFIELRE